jgi:predicted alpha/beta superfamily hydrolase
MILLIGGSVISFGQSTKEAAQPYVLEGTEVRDIHSNIANQDYELIVNLPYSYKENPTKRYPVVYFCDGFYDFPLLAMIYGEQIYDHTIGECFLVGFSYKGKIADYGPLRMYEYSPTEVKERKSGGAPDFLNVIEKEFISFIEKTYRVDPSFRVLGGSSMGGLFTLYAMFTKPSLFNSYIAISPAVNWDKSWLFGVEEAFHRQHPDLPVSLYMTGGEKEFSNDPPFFESIKFFGAVLQKRNYKNFRYTFRVLDDSYHSGSKPEGYARGLKFSFEPLLQK